MLQCVELHQLKMELVKKCVAVCFSVFQCFALCSSVLSAEDGAGNGACVVCACHVCASRVCVWAGGYARVWCV